VNIHFSVSFPLVR